jgi:hypothetical protein
MIKKNKKNTSEEVQNKIQLSAYPIEGALLVLLPD